jgi:hypothetical protein
LTVILPGERSNRSLKIADPSTGRRAGRPDGSTVAATECPSQACKD